jgi:Na+-translocating ferredoxin:NAD+ oxidoreductase RnfD subunit
VKKALLIFRMIVEGLVGEVFAVVLAQTLYRGLHQHKFGLFVVALVWCPLFCFAVALLWDSILISRRLRNSN